MTIVKMADSATMRPAIPITPRDGNRHCSAFLACSSGIVLIRPLCLTQKRNRDLQDASGPTADVGWQPPDRLRSCTPAAEMEWTTPASTHPRGLLRLRRRGNKNEQGCRQK